MSDATKPTTDDMDPEDIAMNDETTNMTETDETMAATADAETEQSATPDEAASAQTGSETAADGDAADDDAVGNGTADGAAANDADSGVAGDPIADDTDDTNGAATDNTDANAAAADVADATDADDASNDDNATEDAAEMDTFAESIEFGVVFDDDIDQPSDDDDDDDALLIDDAVIVDDDLLIDADDAEAEADVIEVIETGAEAIAPDGTAADETDVPTQPADAGDADESSDTTVADATDRHGDAQSSDSPEADSAAETDERSADATESATTDTTITATATDTATASDDAAAGETNKADETTTPASHDGEEPAAPQAVTDVVDANAARVNETLNLARPAGADAATDAAEPGDAFDAARITAEHTLHAAGRRTTATAVSTRIDRELGIGKDDEILLKSNPTFAFDAVGYRNRKTGRNVVERLSLAFQAGGVYAVLVPADDDELRAVLVGLMSGFLLPTEGSVMNKSANYMQLEPSELHGHRVGLVPQRFGVRADLSAVANVVYAMDASGRTFLKPKPVLARELLAAAGLDAGRCDAKAGALSQADRRRVAIARAICCEAQIVVADEPTGGLDDAERDAILATLRELATGDPQRCVIIVTSDETVAEAADRVVEP
ncbi:ATP-binding cassette domain-containing protein [Bifidobacterium phasiani]|uniref:ATP-binding cassette domain-containing protein n=1 Tax=Bifidobacterium phasiani TaxID=2834431 RepID=A0ABS6W6I6_9BIFI|nr:ATP-binding cassette domain-containing protein [Bifidobacterium phasiani]MBW3082099.1 ATP-binding cassette domain-containing protein [Bifidobacterium phasiani]